MAAAAAAARRRVAGDGGLHLPPHAGGRAGPAAGRGRRDRRGPAGPRAVPAGLAGRRAGAADLAAGQGARPGPARSATSARTSSTPSSSSPAQRLTGVSGLTGDVRQAAADRGRERRRAISAAPPAPGTARSPSTTPRCSSAGWSRRRARRRSRRPGSRWAGRTRCASRSTAPQGSLAFDFEDMNVLRALRRHGGRPRRPGFTRILVTEPTHPYLSAWWPPGHGLGYEHGFTHQVDRPGRRDRRRRPSRGRPSPTGCTCSACWPRSRPVLPAQQQLAADSDRRGELTMARPITLFTGQWADLPFEEVARLAAEWGYDGLEIACWGDHLDVWRGAEDDAYIAGPAGDPGRSTGCQVYAISNHLKGQAVCDDPIDERHRDILPDRIWGDGDPEGVRQRAAEEMKMTARTRRAAGRRHRRRLHRLGDLEVRRDVPAGVAGDDRRRLPGLRRPLEPDPRRLRRGRRAVRARGAPARDRLRLLDDGARRWRRSVTGRRSA